MNEGHKREADVSSTKLEWGEDMCTSTESVSLAEGKKSKREEMKTEIRRGRGTEDEGEAKPKNAVFCTKRRETKLKKEKQRV
jgi:hypothetical protein